MACSPLLPLARETTDCIHDESLRARSLLHMVALEHAGNIDSEPTLLLAEGLITNHSDPSARPILACDLAQTLSAIGRDPYRLLDFARSAAIGYSTRAEIYIALVEAKLGILSDRRLQWAEEFAEAQGERNWLIQTQATAARIRAEQCNWDAARETIERIDDSMHQFASWCELALIAHKQHAFSVLKSVPQFGTIARLTDYIRARCVLAMTVHSIGLDASDQLRHLASLGTRVEDYHQHELLGTCMARALARCGQYATAQRVIEALPESAQLAARLAACQESARAGDVAGTRELAGRLMKPGYRDRALCYIVESIADNVRLSVW